MFRKYLGRIWGDVWSRMAPVSTIITFVTFFLDVPIDLVNVPSLAWLLITLVWGISIFLAGYRIWRDDVREYHRTDPEIHCDTSSLSLKQWLDIEPKTGFYVTQPIIASFSASLRVYNPRSRLIHLQTTVADVNSNWVVLEQPEVPKVINPHHAGQYRDGVINVNAEGTVPVSISFDIHFSPATDENGERYLQCLRELVIVLEFEAPGRKPVLVAISPDRANVHEQVKKRIANLLDHELVKRNHWREQGLELFAKYENSC